MNHAIPSSRLAAAAAAAALATLSLACGPSENGNGNGGACEGMLPGDLVITEVMANPDGDQTGKQYWEFYNASGMELDLSGLLLHYSREDGTGVREHLMPQAIVQPGQYFVVGNVLDELRPDHVDYGYGNAISLRNDGAVLALRCGTTEVDSMTYPAARNAVAYQLSGNLAPDHILNNDPNNWCEATETFDGGVHLGSPGQSNEACPNVILGECNDNGTIRPTRVPIVGDLIITEVMPRPTTPQADREWFEIHALNDVDLNGLTIGRSTSTGSNTRTINSADCLDAPAGTYVLFARNADTTVNGGLPEVDFTFSFVLVDSDGDLFLEYEGDLLDQITWTSSRQGVSHALDPDKYDPIENDDEENWSDCQIPYGDGDLGTPRADNALCDLSGLCLDNGTPRAPVPPEAGQLVITEVMARPSVNPTGAREWFEVAVVGGGLDGFDLNDLVVGRDGASTTISPPECARVVPGDHIVFGRNTEPTENGGIPVVHHLFNFALRVGGEELYLRHGDTVIDSMTYSAAQVEDEGVALALDPDKTNTVDNSDPNNWCPATVPYGDGDLGTPGSVNVDSCPE